VLVLHVTLYTFRAKASLVERKVFPWLKADHAVVFDFELNAALLSAEAAMSLYDSVRLNIGVPAHCGNTVQSGAELINESDNVYR
jgi:hypothetical protein